MRRAPRACGFLKTLERRPSVCPDPTPTLSNIPGRCRPSFLFETPHVSLISRKVRSSPLTILDSGSPVLTRALKEPVRSAERPVRSQPWSQWKRHFPRSADDNPSPPAPVDRRACETPGTIHIIWGWGLVKCEYCCNGSTSVLAESCQCCQYFDDSGTPHDNASNVMETHQNEQHRRRRERCMQNRKEGKERAIQQLVRFSHLFTADLPPLKPRNCR